MLLLFFLNFFVQLSLLSVNKLYAVSFKMMYFFPLTLNIFCEKKTFFGDG